MHGLLYAAPLVWAALDRLWGSVVAFTGKKAAMAVASLGFGFLAGGITGLLFGLVWFVWRSVPFFNGSGAPQTPSERLAAVLRHAPVVIPAALIAYWRGLAEPQTALAFGAFALGAVTLAWAYGAATARHKAAGEGGGRENVAVELARSALYGLAVLLSLILWR